MSLRNQLKWSVLIGLLSFCTLSIGQTKDRNPFELPDRVQKNGEVQEPVKIETPEKEVEQGNPFDVNPTGIKKEKELATSENPFELVEQAASSKKVEPVEKIRTNPATPIRKKGSSSDWLLFGLLIIVGAYSGFLSSLNMSGVRKAFDAFMRQNLSSLMFREQQGEIVSWQSLLVYVLYVLVGGAFVYLAMDLFGFSPIESASIRLILSIVAVGLMTFFRHLALKLIAMIFPFTKEMGYYNFTIAIFNQIIGIVLIPFVVFMAFGPEEMKIYGFWGGVILLAGIYCFRAIRGLFIAEKYISMHKFHFLLYLCTVEIAPIIVLVKLSLMWGQNPLI